MTPTESLLKELEELEAKATPYNAVNNADFVRRFRNSLPALLQIIRTQREELERMAKVDVSLLSNELAAARALRHWVFARDALSRCDEIAQTVSSLGAKGVKG